MVEGGIAKADNTEFTECWRVTWKTPYIMKLALSAGIGGLLFGYDTGVISGALLYIKEDFEDVNRKTWLQETIVSMAVAGAIVGAAFGGWMNDKYGRKKSIMGADVFFFIGSIVMALAPAPWVIIVGRILVGLGVGMASITSPLYISEASPARVRGALVSTNGLLLTGGQFLAYLINLAFTQVHGTWRWMLGIAAIPALVQFFLMLSLPESPRWLYRQDKVEEAESILAKIYPPEDVITELKALQQTIEEENALDGSFRDSSFFHKLKSALGNTVVRRGLYAGIAVQVTQQIVGINTVMYYSPTIVQFAGFASKQTALALSLVTSGLNAIGSIVSMVFVDRYGRRRLMIISLIGIIICLVAIFVVFTQAAAHAPVIDAYQSTHFSMGNSTCSAYTSATNGQSWSCMSCLKAECGFCSNIENKYAPGACLAKSKDIKSACYGEHRVFFEDGCPSKFGFLAVVLLGAYIISYSPGMGTAPWIVNSEIYPLRYRGIGGGIAATCNWTANLLVSETFLTLTVVLGPGGTFLLFAGFSLIGLIFIYFLVPETKGKTFEQIEQMLQKGYKPKAFRKRNINDNQK